MRMHRSKRKQRRGSILMTSAVMVTMLVMLAAMTVDYGYMHASKSRMQSAADAAALAAAMRIGNENTAETRTNAQAWATGFANSNLPNKGSVLVSDDIVFGNWDPASETFAASNDTPNAVQVLVRRDGKNAESVATYFMNIFGVKEIGLKVAATATITPTSAAEGVPMALRAPGFGSIAPASLSDDDDDDDDDEDDEDDDDDDDDEDDDDEPSSPENGESFEVGDKVVVAVYGEDEQSSAHLTLNIDADGDGASETDVTDILNGSDDSVEMQVGDEASVFNAGTGDSGYGEALDDRLDLGSDDPGRNIVMPVVETLPDSRDFDGQLTGKVRIADFVSVHLDEMVEVEVDDPDTPGQTLTVRYLMGTVTNRRAKTSWGGATPSGAGGRTVTLVELVQ